MYLSPCMTFLPLAKPKPSHPASQRSPSAWIPLQTLLSFTCFIFLLRLYSPALHMSIMVQCVHCVLARAGSRSLEHCLLVLAVFGLVVQVWDPLLSGALLYVARRHDGLVGGCSFFPPVSTGSKSGCKVPS